MRQAVPLRADCEVTPQGVLHATLRGPGAASCERIAIALDGIVHTVAEPSRGGRGKRTLRWELPRHLIAGELDLLAMQDGASILAGPLSLGRLYNLQAEPPALHGLVLHGSFTAAAFLPDTLGIELLDGIAPIGRSLAHRAPQTCVWAYRLPVGVLLAPGRTAHLSLRIGGHILASPKIKVGTSDLGYAGCLDVATPGRAEGWAINLRAPERKVMLDILVDAAVVATVRADERREDLRGPAQRDGKCGFGFDMPEAADPNARLRVSVRIAGERTDLTNSPVVIEPRPDLLGRFDILHGMSAHGWATDRAHPDRKLMVEAVGPGGEMLGQATANIFRGDLLGAGLADGLCAFKIDLAAHFDRLVGRDISVRIAGTDLTLPGSPIRIMPNGNMQRFLRRRDMFLTRPGVLPRLKRALNHRAGEAGISIIMPVYNTPRGWLSEALESVRHQFCDNWELICVNDGSSTPHVAELLASYARNDVRVRVLTSPHNVGVTRATNFGLRAARHGYVTFLDHDDYLEPDAVWQLLRAARATGADLLYGDELLTDESLRGVLEFRLRPAFSHDFYLSHPYFVHPVCVRTDIARAVGGLDESMPISADVDFVLRIIEASRRITHVPAVLYRWRTHPASSGHAKQDSVMAATIGALQRHLDRLGRGGIVSEGPWFNQFRVDWPASDGRILIVMPTKNGRKFLQTAIESIERTAGDTAYRLVVIDHDSDDADTQEYLRAISGRHVVMPYTGAFNFSRMNNQAVARHGAGCDFVLFLNNDVEATQAGWLDRLRALANRPEVGAVGALLMYGDKRVQHAGVILGFNNSADHALRLHEVFLNDAGRRNLGYNCGLTSVRDYSAVTAACVMMRRAVFEKVRGFDEKFGIGFNDTDLCLRIGAAGYRILYDGYTMLYHYESATRAQTKQVFHPADTKRMVKRWGKLLAAGDPFYNPNLSLRTQDHVPREDSGCRITHQPRVITISK
jgi:GT2 family glycosyltransferase